ncbi:MAG: hypothetical protein H6492_01735 [Candidatus Paracaedibacteraceae bacterium]|nr:hypothetical protein [Candidatus Paracaedibacteraceae bacterium]
MSYRNKTPSVVSILKRKLKPGKTFEDFQIAHLPGANAKKNEFGYEVDFFGVPTRVINAVCAEDPNIVYSIGLSYGEIDEIFKEATKKSQEDSQPGRRGEKLDNICDDMASPVIAFVASDNDYGGKRLDYKQTKLAKVTPEISQAIKEMLNQHSKELSSNETDLKSDD